MPHASLEEFYRDLFGERWSSLKEAMVSPGPYAIRLNRMSTASAPAGRPCEGLEGVLLNDEPFPRPPSDHQGRPAWYAMDAASVLAARVLQVGPGERVLDMCAAPGGKSLVLMEGGPAELVANDRSAARRARLVQVLDAYLDSATRAQVKVTGHDATPWALHQRDAYDAILLDAPCSSEAHVLQDPKALREWTPARSRQLARRQYAMLAAALDAVRVGGRIFYSTCALVPAENDGVVGRLLQDRRRTGRARRREPAWVLPSWVEPTEHGWLAAPDTGGFGPLYFSLLERLA